MWLLRARHDAWLPAPRPSGTSVAGSSGWSGKSCAGAALCRYGPSMYKTLTLVLLSAILALSLSIGDAAGSKGTMASSCYVRFHGFDGTALKRKHVSCRAAKRIIRGYVKASVANATINGWRCRHSHVLESATCRRGSGYLLIGF